MNNSLNQYNEIFRQLSGISFSEMCGLNFKAFIFADTIDLQKQFERFKIV